jgi:hypothetical protein
MNLDGVTLTPAQEARHAALVRRVIGRGGLTREGAETAIADVWRLLYRMEGDAWVRREVCSTTRGYHYAQRPDE